MDRADFFVERQDELTRKFHIAVLEANGAFVEFDLAYLLFTAASLPERGGRTAIRMPEANSVAGKESERLVLHEVACAVFEIVFEGLPVVIGDDYGAGRYTRQRT